MEQQRQWNLMYKHIFCADAAAADALLAHSNASFQNNGNNYDNDNDNKNNI